MAKMPLTCYTSTRGATGTFNPDTRISLCTSICNRAHQFKHVFTKNIKIIAATPNVEWVILNYNSTDDLDQFMLTQLDVDKGRGKVVYLRETSGRSWHASCAKNIAHRSSSGDIVMNLDADNYIGDAIEQMKNCYRWDQLGALHNWSGVHMDGTYGRISARRQVFMDLHGYDEEFYPMGYQDTDLVMRMIGSGARVGLKRCPSEVAIPNNKDESIANCKDGSLTWLDFNSRNRQASRARYLKREFIANTTKAEWGMGQVEFITAPLPRANNDNSHSCQ